MYMTPYHSQVIELFEAANMFLESAKGKYFMDDNEAESLAQDMTELDMQGVFDAYMLSCAAKHRTVKVNPYDKCK